MRHGDSAVDGGYHLRNSVDGAAETGVVQLAILRHRRSQFALLSNLFAFGGADK
jgi:hypothetical protein